MQLPDFLSKLLPNGNNQEVGRYFFALNIREHEVEGAVWGIEDKSMRVLRTAKSRFEDENGLIEAANLALDDALADFLPEPTQVLFGVPDSWLQDENLKPEYSKLLQRLVKELDVEPMAYVSSTHAIAHFLQKQSGVPTTAVLVEVSDPLTVSVAKAGRILASRSKKRSDNVPEDVEKILMELHEIEVLPSKILLYGGGDLDKYEEEMVTFPWMTQLAFLHLPKIETLPEDLVIKAVCMAGASELEEGVTYNDRTAFTEAPTSQRRVTRSAEELGFVEGDIRSRRNPLPGEEPIINEFQQEYSQLGGKLDGVKAILFGFLPTLNLKGKRSSPLNVPKLGVIVPVILLVVLIGAAIILPKAKVTIFVDLRVLEKDAQVVADPKVAEVDEEAKKIPGKVIDTSVNGTAKGSASGKKQVGDPAKGVVIVYNKTTSSKSFPSGTVLVGPNNLKFTLDTAAQVASKSAVIGGESYGKVTANITASSIGPDSNLPAGKELAIQGQSTDSFNAYIDTALSGGISKDVTVVTSDDQKKLLASHASDLRKKARDELQSKLTGDMKVLEESLVENISKQSFSKNVNDQASEFTLNMTIGYKGTSYSDNDLKTIVSKLVETNVPEGYELDLTKTETQATVSRVEKDGRLIFQAKFRAKLMAKIDIDKIKKDIAGKSPDQAADQLRTIENVIGSNIDIKPSFPGPLRRLPFLPQNIEIEVTAK